MGLILGAGPVWAGPETLPEVGRGHATVLTEGELLEVEGVGGIVRMAGIQIPGQPEQEEAATREAAAYAVLTDLVDKHAVSVRALPVVTDRNGRTLAHLIRDDGLWIEGELVRAGLARVAPTPDTDMFATELLSLEDDARLHGRGLWSDAAFAVRAADGPRLEEDSGTYQIVEGRVVNASRHGDMFYLDFGADYRTDFTVTIPSAKRIVFKTAGINPLELSGQKVRVRGWVSRYRGPVMELTTPAALQVLK